MPQQCVTEHEKERILNKSIKRIEDKFEKFTAGKMHETKNIPARIKDINDKVLVELEKKQVKIWDKKYIEKVRKLIKETMAGNLPNLPNSDIVYDLIRDLVSEIESVSMSQIKEVNAYISEIIQGLIKDEFSNFDQFLNATISKVSKTFKVQSEIACDQIKTRILQEKAKIISSSDAYINDVTRYTAAATQTKN